VVGNRLLRCDYPQRAISTSLLWNLWPLKCRFNSPNK